MQEFHPIIKNWFIREFERPTEIQTKAWPEIKKGRHTLIAAPTGSGKTLAAFLSAIDDIYRQSLDGELVDAVQVVYVSPLKALSNDIEKNLQKPLQGIQELSEKSGNGDLPKIRVAVRTGDTPQSARAAMLRTPPHILVTTPESLFLLLTSEKSRAMLRTAKTVIVDEIHAMIGDKRGSHLALSIERLQHIAENPLTRIGLSATQRPIEQVARFLTGSRDNEKPDCAILNTGHKREMDIGMVIPDSPLSAVMANEVWSEYHKKLEKLILEHTTTLIFVNTRRLAERLAHTLTGILGKDVVTAHHGSLSKDQRLEAETKLKDGELRALIATASLELGIDIGAVDLVVQIGSPRSISAFLQRVGRSGHTVHGTPKGRVLPLSRDDLVECTALLRASRNGDLDKIVMPEKPIDILAQQMVAEAANEDWDESALYNLFSSSYPYRELTEEEFGGVVRMLSDGFSTRRGRRGAYIHHDAVNQVIKPRKGARLAAVMNGGAIPDNFSYDVVLEPSGTYIGNIHEDFAIESTAGDIFALGNSSWRVLGVQTGKVRVEDAEGMPPTIPFWLGEAPGRTAELSEAVSDLREFVGQELQKLLDGTEEADFVVNQYVAQVSEAVVEETGIPADAALQLTQYLSGAYLAIGSMPSQQTIVIERFFDETGDMHMVIHSPFGSEVNRAWGLALRKKFCRNFNFELQAAANDDALILSLGPTHSFQLDTVFKYLHPNTVRNTLVQALLDAPMFEVRWRWNANRSLAVLKRRSGKRVAPQLQRMDAEDLLALTFPDQLACLENIAGDREVPDHPLVNQTIHDCLTEAMDIEKLESILTDLLEDKIKCVAIDLREASPLAHEILNANPYAFLDPAPLEERRTQAVKNRRWLDPAEAGELSKLDPGAIEKVREEAWPSPRSKDELHDALLLHAFITAGEAKEEWQIMFDDLREAGRAGVLLHPRSKTSLWIATERLPQFRAAFENVVTDPDLVVPKAYDHEWIASDALKEILRGRLEACGPVTEATLCDRTGLSREVIHFALSSLENEGFVFQGNYTGETTEIEWCERRLLARINQYTLNKLRREIRPVSLQNFARFLFEWQRLVPGEKPAGPDALEAIVEQLEGYEAPAAAWEGSILPARLAEYDPVWLDVMCMSGKVTWGRFRVSPPEEGGNGKSAPIKTTPVTLVTRRNMHLWQHASNKAKEWIEVLRSETRIVFDEIRNRGASFFDDICKNTRLLNTQVETALAELVARGLVNSDSFTGLRALLTPINLRPRLHEKSGRRGKRAVFGMESAGRWSVLIEEEEEHQEDAKPAEYEGLFELARTLLRRYGVVFRGMVAREPNLPPWRELVRVFRRLEIRGEIRGGRFVDGVYGEQFALADAIGLIRKIRNKELDGTIVTVSAVDPANMMGTVLPGDKVPAHHKNRILFRDGLPIAKIVAGEVTFLTEFEPEEKWQLRNELKKQIMPDKLRAYLGK